MIQMRFTIVQTNRLEHRFQVPRTNGNGTEERVVVHEPGRIIAEHNIKETVDRHCERLRKKFPNVEFEVIECGTAEPPTGSARRDRQRSLFGEPRS